MSLLKEILEEAFLLKEDASVDAINNAVKNMHPVWIAYNGPSGGGKNRRLIYPVAYGLSTAGNPVVRAFQPQGSTSTDVPAWKLFRLDRIKTWRNINSKTFNPGDLRGFNDGGDEQIETLYAIAPAGKGTPVYKPAEPKEPEKIITGHPVRKGEVDNGGADKNTEKDYYTGNEVIRNILNTSNPKIAQTQDKNIDKVAGQDYNSKETIPARDTVPVTKADVGGPEVTNEPEETNISQNANDGPVMKADVDAEGQNQDTLATAFKDLTDRMDNRYNDEEEEEKI